MKIIKPTTMTLAMLSATNAANVDADYVAGTSYPVAQRVTYDNSIWQSLSPANGGNTPNVSPLKWTRIGPSNKWAMFDDQVNTTTNRSDSLVVTLVPGMLDTLALINVDAGVAKLVVRETPGGTVVYEDVRSLAGEEVRSWFEYFFSDATARVNLAVFYNIPLISTCTATLTITSVGALSIGSLVFGRLSSIGPVNHGASAGITDFSRKATDEFGVTTFVKRNYSNRLSSQIAVETRDLNRVQRLLKEIRATPVLWIGTDAPEYSESLVLFGYYRDFYSSIEYHSHAIYSLEIEGLI